MAIAAAGAACVVFVLLGLLVYRAVAASTAVQFDELLQQQATLALRYADHEYGEGDTVVPPAAALPPAMPFDVIYQIGTRSGQVLYRSPRAPAAPLTAGEGPGCTNVALSGRWWRTCSLGSRSTPLVIHMAEPLDYRAALLSRTMRAVAVPLSFALVLLTVLIGLVTERAFRPVRRIAAELAERRDDDLSPVNTAEMPVETHGLGVALNGLLARQAEVLARERRFTADAAHELRTPLASLRVQAQVAARARSVRGIPGPLSLTVSTTSRSPAATSSATRPPGLTLRMEFSSRLRSSRYRTSGEPGTRWWQPATAIATCLSRAPGARSSMTRSTTRCASVTCPGVNDEPGSSRDNDNS